MPIIRYGMKWDDELDDAEIERKMIQNGGYMTFNGRQYGVGLLQHFKAYWAALWPEDSQTWWTDLILENIIKHQFVSLVGAASAWKSGTVARMALMDWSCFPDCTSVIMSSTNLEGLKSRIYGETTMMWKRASERFEWFPGNPVDSKCVITNTNVEEESARDIRNSILGIACKTSSGTFIGMGCFVRGTMVDTPFGPKPIEDFKPGDLVVNATGCSKVRSVMVKQSHSVVKLKFCDGSEIVCTPDHPFLTSSGWENASCLNPNHRLISPDETLSILQDTDAKRPRESEVLLKEMPDGKLSAGMQGVSETIRSEGYERNFLHEVLRSEMEIEAAGNCRQNDCGEKSGVDGYKFEPVFTGKQERDIAALNSGEEKFQTPETPMAKSRSSLPDHAGINYSGKFPGGNLGVSGENWIKCENGACELLPSGCGVAEPEIGRGIGWDLPQPSVAENKRCNTHKVFRTKRLESVEVLEQGNKISTSKSPDGYTVYNLEVENHPSYSVQGLIVHNSYAGRKNRRVWCIGDEFQFMQLSILQAQDNLISNDDGSGLFGGFYPADHPDPQERGKPRRSYRCIFIGNTNPSVRDNPLDVVSEPEFGWSSIEEATEEKGKTQVWKCKKHSKHPVQCHCVNLDGLDSPNSPYPIDRPRWSHLAGPHKLQKYTVGSESYWSNGRGRFKFGLDAFKIITKELCDQFHAFDDVEWDGATTKIGALDAAYGSAEGAGDRCVLGWLQFGKNVDGKVRIKFEEMWLVPIVIRKDMVAEDQIAMYCKDKMSGSGVLPENFFFDGRGSLAMSLGRIWSTDVHSLEFGGTPTERPSGPDVYITPEGGARRLQTARERYRKFVSELWWAWRYVIEADQMRGLNLDIVLDAQPREWAYVAKNKIDIETKKELKERTGISPDLADMLVTGIEGARRKGFVISKLGNLDAQKNDKTAQWFLKQFQKTEKLRTSRQLQAA